MGNLCPRQDAVGGDQGNPVHPDVALETGESGPTSHHSVVDEVMEAETQEVLAKLSIDESLFEIPFEDLDVQRSIGSGGSGALIFRAKWQGNIVAFKCFKIFDFLDQNRFSEFEKEVEMLASLSHPNILEFYGATLRPPRIGMVIEYCPNGDLKNYLTRNLDVPLRIRVRFLREIANAMSYLHSHQVLHRDLKPENVLLAENDRCKIMDFGLSRVARAEEAKTMKIGTSHYMAPEIVLTANYDEKIDVYSFAIMSFEILTGNMKPFGDVSDFNIEVRVANDAGLRPQIERSAELPAEIVRMMLRCWDHRPEMRNSFREIAEMLSEESESEFTYGDESLREEQKRAAKEVQMQVLEQRTQKLREAIAGETEEEDVRELGEFFVGGEEGDVHITVSSDRISLGENSFEIEAWMGPHSFYCQVEEDQYFYFTWIPEKNGYHWVIQRGTMLDTRHLLATQPRLTEEKRVVGVFLLKTFVGEGSLDEVDDGQLRETAIQGDHYWSCLGNEGKRRINWLSVVAWSPIGPDDEDSVWHWYWHPQKRGYHGVRILKEDCVRVVVRKGGGKEPENSSRPMFASLKYFEECQPKEVAVAIKLVEGRVYGHFVCHQADEEVTMIVKKNAVTVNDDEYRIEEWIGAFSFLYCVEGTEMNEWWYCNWVAAKRSYYCVVQKSNSIGYKWIPESEPEVMEADSKVIGWFTWGRSRVRISTDEFRSAGLVHKIEWISPTSWCHKSKYRGKETPGYYSHYFYNPERKGYYCVRLDRNDGERDFVFHHELVDEDPYVFENIETDRKRHLGTFEYLEESVAPVRVEVTPVAINFSTGESFSIKTWHNPYTFSYAQDDQSMWFVLYLPLEDAYHAVCRSDSALRNLRPVASESSGARLTPDGRRIGFFNWNDGTSRGVVQEDRFITGGMEFEIEWLSPFAFCHTNVTIRKNRRKDTEVTRHSYFIWWEKSQFYLGLKVVRNEGFRILEAVYEEGA